MDSNEINIGDNVLLGTRRGTCLNIANILPGGRIVVYVCWTDGTVSDEFVDELTSDASEHVVEDERF